MVTGFSKQKNGTEAVELFRAHKDDIHALLLDVIMPGKNGIEAFEEMRNIKPDAKVLFMSGYTNDILSKKGLKEDELNLITKPLRPAELLNRLKMVLNRGV